MTSVNWQSKWVKTPIIVIKASSLVVGGVLIPYIFPLKINAPIEKIKYVQKDLIDKPAIGDLINSSNNKIYSRLNNDIIQYVMESCKEYNLPPQLVFSVIKAESSFNPFAVSKKNAKGIMQIYLESWRKELIEKKIIHSDSDIFDPKINIRAGCYILRLYINQTKNLKKALFRYLGDDYLPYINSIQDNLGLISMMEIEREVVK